MANRAYLYASESEEFHRLGHPDTHYYDSRWVIPLAWLFLYRPADVVRVEVNREGSHWQEVKLRTPKAAATEVFAARWPLLFELVGGWINSRVLDEFLNDLADWPGDWLLMDPEEVFGGMNDDERARAERLAVLDLLDDPARSQAAREEAMWYIGGRLDDDYDGCVGQVIGYTYTW